MGRVWHRARSPAGIGTWELNLDDGTSDWDEQMRVLRGHPPQRGAMTKAQIVRLGMELRAPLELTWSCYQGGDKACGRCDACLLRLKGFAEGGSKDPLDYLVRP